MGCRRTAPVDQLVRIVSGPDATVLVGRNAPGRGAWLCAGSPACLQRAIRRGAFERALRKPVTASALQSLRALLDAGETDAANVRG